MAFQYHGSIERLKAEVEHFKDRIDDAYKDILGKERYEKLESIANKTLIPECYFESLADFKRYNGDDVPSKLELTPGYILNPRENPSRFWRKLKSITVAPSFYLSEEAMKKSIYYIPTNPLHYLPIFTHEFNHFVFSVLQNHPLASISFSSDDEMSIRMGEDFERFVEILEKEEDDPREKRSRMHEVLTDTFLDVFSETGTRILDSLVAKSYGLNLKNNWRGIAPRFTEKRLSGIPESFYFYSAEGDIFHDVDDLEVIDRLINWQDNFYLPFDNSHILKEIQKLKKIPTEFTSITDLIERYPNISTN